MGPNSKNVKTGIKSMFFLYPTVKSTKMSHSYGKKVLAYFFYDLI